MNNKKELQKQAEKLQKELDILRNKIDSEEDIFSITSYKEVCKILEEDQQCCPYKKIKQIEKFFNQGWKPNWKNTNEYKYYPYFSVGSGGGLGFDVSVDASYCVGAVAFYKSKEISDYVGKTFIKEYQEFRDNY